ncbi:MAG: hypothetical protein WBG61_02955 [Desulfobacterales bacterium]|jgi:hypothetical protein|nr:hypothetical protein [Desulfobacterales bacterium]HUT43169.1 hypothetical protein [Desulfobacterales bacterium]
MLKLKIRIFKNNDTAPDTTMTVPLALIKVASKLVPRKAVKVLDDLGIDLDQIIEISKTEEPLGTLAEIEEHKKNRKIIISIE